MNERKGVQNIEPVEEQEEEEEEEAEDCVIFKFNFYVQRRRMMEDHHGAHKSVHVQSVKTIRPIPLIVNCTNFILFSFFSLVSGLHLTRRLNYTLTHL